MFCLSLPPWTWAVTRAFVPVLLAFYYSSTCRICEIKVAFSYVAVVIAMYMMTGSVKYPQEIKIQKIHTGVRTHLGHLSLCLSKVIAYLYHPDGIVKSGLGITDESSMAKRSLAARSCVHQLSQFSPSTVTPVPHNASVLFPFCHRFLSSPLWLCIVSDSQQLRGAFDL